MTETFVTPEQLRRVAAAVGELHGWDFSRVRAARDPVPWNYAEVVRRFLQPESRVLDIGTGGGEKFLLLAGHADLAVGSDPDRAMIRTARENRPPELEGKVLFAVGRAQELPFVGGSFDVVLNRHAPVFVDEIVRVLRPGGLFITQQVGGRNTQSIFTAFGWDSNDEVWREYWRREGLPPQDVAGLSWRFREAGCAVVARGVYDVGYSFLDLESLVFWLKSAPLPEEFDPGRHSHGVNRLLGGSRAPRGIATNEHRELLIVRKGQ